MDKINKKKQTICTECGASDSCKKVDFKEFMKIKKKCGLVYKPKKKLIT